MTERRSPRRSRRTAAGGARVRGDVGVGAGVTREPRSRGAPTPDRAGPAALRRPDVDLVPPAERDLADFAPHLTFVKRLPASAQTVLEGAPAPYVVKLPGGEHVRNLFEHASNRVLPLATPPRDEQQAGPHGWVDQTGHRFADLRHDRGEIAHAWSMRWPAWASMARSSAARRAVSDRNDLARLRGVRHEPTLMIVDSRPRGQGPRATTHRRCILDRAPW